MKHTFVLSICSWGEFDIRISDPHSVHPSEERAITYGQSLGLLDHPPEDDGIWYEVRKVPSFL